MNIPQYMLIAVDFAAEGTPATAREFRPVVFLDGEDYCVLLGEDPQSGIFGCGDSAEHALQNWDRHLKQRLANHRPGDELVQYIHDARLMSNHTVG